MSFSEITGKSQRFYENFVAPMIHNKFPNYEGRIAVGLVGEGSDCFGYDDFMSRDHDFGTGVCLWLTDEDFDDIGCLLSIAYNELVEKHGGKGITERLMERRGVMTIHNFYSNILYVDCNTTDGIISDDDWYSFEHSCIATAVNGIVFRDDLGEFSRFRNKLLDYYPEKIWRRLLANELHRFSASLQVNYARCMSRNDTVAAELCRAQGVDAAMQLFFLINKKYAPYYKWTYRALKEIDLTGDFSSIIKDLAETCSNDAAWRYYRYNPNTINRNDIVTIKAEKVAQLIANLLFDKGLIHNDDPYLEQYVNMLIS